MTQNKDGLVLDHFNELTTARHAVQQLHGLEHPLLTDHESGRMTLLDVIETIGDDYVPFNYAWNAEEADVILGAMKHLIGAEESWFASNAALALGSLAAQQLQLA